MDGCLPPNPWPRRRSRPAARNPPNWRGVGLERGLMGVGQIADLFFYLLQRGIELQRLDLSKNRGRLCDARARDAEEAHDELPQG
jgi:hypothetical protein